MTERDKLVMECMMDAILDLPFWKKLCFTGLLFLTALFPKWREWAKRAAID